MLNFGVPYQLLRPWDVMTVPRLIESRSYLIKMKKKKKGVILLLLQKMSIVYIKTCFSWKILSVSSVADKKSEGH